MSWRYALLLSAGGLSPVNLFGRWKRGIMASNASPCGLTKELSCKFANMALVCSFFVVFIHTGTKCVDGDSIWWMMHLFQNGICRVAVPFFFIASGFFLAGHCFEEGWWRNECKKRIRTLLVPYVIWCTVHFLYSTILIIGANIYAGAELSRNLPVSVLDWLNVFGLTCRKWPYYVPLWFVRWLLVMILCSHLFIGIIRRGKTVAVVYLTLLFIAFVYGGPLFRELPVLQVFSFAGMFFFNLGLFLRIYPLQVRISLPMAVTLFGIGMGLFTCDLYGQLNTVDWLKYLHPFAIVCVLVGVWTFVPSRQWGCRIVTCSFPIFLLHVFVLSPLDIAKRNLPALPYPSGITEYLLNGVLAIGGSIVIALLFRKFFPKTATVFFGGR